jgi:hypothetical protein
VITVLLAAARVAPGCLDMAARIGAYPDILVSRRDGECIDAGDFVFVVDGFAGDVEVNEAFFAPLARVARPAVVRMPQARRHGGGVARGVGGAALGRSVRGCHCCG